MLVSNALFQPRVLTGPDLKVHGSTPIAPPGSEKEEGSLDGDTLSCYEPQGGQPNVVSEKMRVLDLSKGKHR